MENLYRRQRRCSPQLRDGVDGWQKRLLGGIIAHVGRTAELAKQTVVDARIAHGEVPAVVHVVGAVDASHRRVRRHVVAVERRQHHHRNEDRQQEP